MCHGFDWYIFISHYYNCCLLEKGAYPEDSHTVHCHIKLAFLLIIYVTGFCAQHQVGGRRSLGHGSRREKHPEEDQQHHCQEV